MYKSKEDEKWKWMALAKETLTAKIPKRQFVNLKIETLMNELDKMFMNE